MPNIIDVGWFDHPFQKEPTHDPGLGTLCPICDVVLRVYPRTTISVSAKDSGISLFFRAHKQCWDAAPEDVRRSIESRAVEFDISGLGEA